MRNSCVNPILFVNDKERISEIQKDMQKGEVSVPSSLELAMKKDAQIEFESGQPTDENLESKTTYGKMFQRYLALV